MKSEWVNCSVMFHSFYNSMDCGPPGSSVHGILQAKTVEWVAIPSPEDLPDPGIEPRSPALLVNSLLSEPPGKCLREYICIQKENMKPFCISDQFSSVAQSCPTLCNPMDCSTPGFPGHHQLPELTQKLMSIESVMPSNNLSLCHPLLFPPSQHLGLFQ